MSMWINTARGEWKAVFLKAIGIEKMEPGVVYEIPSELDQYMEGRRRIGIFKVEDIQAMDSKPKSFKDKILTEKTATKKKPANGRRKKKKK